MALLRPPAKKGLTFGLTLISTSIESQNSSRVVGSGALTERVSIGNTKTNRHKMKTSGFRIALHRRIVGFSDIGTGQAKQLGIFTFASSASSNSDNKSRAETTKPSTFDRTVLTLHAID